MFLSLTVRSGRKYLPKKFPANESHDVIEPKGSDLSHDFALPLREKETKVDGIVRDSINFGCVTHLKKVGDIYIWIFFLEPVKL